MVDWDLQCGCFINAFVRTRTLTHAFQSQIDSNYGNKWKWQVQFMSMTLFFVFVSRLNWLNCKWRIASSSKNMCSPNPMRSSPMRCVISNSFICTICFRRTSACPLPMCNYRERVIFILKFRTFAVINLPVRHVRMCAVCMLERTFVLVINDFFFILRKKRCCCRWNKWIKYLFRWLWRCRPLVLHVIYHRKKQQKKCKM